LAYVFHSCHDPTVVDEATSCARVDEINTKAERYAPRFQEPRARVGSAASALGSSGRTEHAIEIARLDRELLAERAAALR
jgi:hypothetical protein